MIVDVIKFLRDRLNGEMPRDAAGGSAEELFVYPGTSKDDSLSFPSNAVSILLVRIEEETALRPPDLYAQGPPDGVRTRRVAPEVRMNLFILFVARFPDDYGLALSHLSKVIHFFQTHRVFNGDNSPTLQHTIPQLILELVTPSFSEQNEIWGALRAPYQPSALYKVKMVVFADPGSERPPPPKELRWTIRTSVPSTEAK